MRDATNKILEMIDEGLLDPKMIAEIALGICPKTMFEKWLALTTSTWTKMGRQTTKKKITTIMTAMMGNPTKPKNGMILTQIVKERKWLP